MSDLVPFVYHFSNYIVECTPVYEKRLTLLLALKYYYYMFLQL